MQLYTTQDKSQQNPHFIIPGGITFYADSTKLLKVYKTPANR